MRNTSEMPELLIHQKALAMHNLTVKTDRTPEEDKTLRKLLEDALSALTPVVPAQLPATDDFDDDTGFEPNEPPLADSTESTPAATVVPQTPTIAVTLARRTKAGAVEIKQQLKEQVGANVGATRVPLTNVSNLVENSMFLSPGKTTLNVERTVRLSVKKADGSSFEENNSPVL